MTFFDWLETPDGMHLLYAVGLVLVALSAVLSALAAKIAHGNTQLLNDHLEEHVQNSDLHPRP